MEHFRLDKLVSELFKLTRKQAKYEISAGNITVNGTVIKQGAMHCFANDEICLSGQRGVYQKYFYIMMNKPQGVLSATKDIGAKTAVQLLPDSMFRKDLFVAGRLDKNTTGFLLLTNDGAFAQRLMHPKHEVDKTYEAWVTGHHPGCPALLRRSIELDGYRIRQPEVKLLWEDGQKAKYLITIHEGRNRQVRRMCSAAGMQVTRLRRIGEGKLRLGDLPKGKWRYLTEEEIAEL